MKISVGIAIESYTRQNACVTICNQTSPSPTPIRQKSDLKKKEHLGVVHIQGIHHEVCLYVHA